MLIIQAGRQLIYVLILLRFRIVDCLFLSLHSALSPCIDGFNFSAPTTDP